MPPPLAGPQPLALALQTLVERPFTVCVTQGDGARSQIRVCGLAGKVSVNESSGR